MLFSLFRSGTCCLEWRRSTPANAVTQNGFCEQVLLGGCLNFCKEEIRQIELFVVRLAQAMPAESERRNGKQQLEAEIRLSINYSYLKYIKCLNIQEHHAKMY